MPFHFSCPTVCPFFFLEIRAVSVKPSDDHLKDFRVDILKLGPPFFEVGETVLFRGVRRVLHTVHAVEKVITDLPAGIQRPR